MATQEWKEKNQEKIRKYRRDWYYRNKELSIQRKEARKKALISWFREYKSRLECIVCGETFIYCLEFHHKDSSKKDIEVGRAVQNGWGKKKIIKEIDKCDVLCANCHRKEHYKNKCDVE